MFYKTVIPFVLHTCFSKSIKLSYWMHRHNATRNNGYDAYDRQWIDRGKLLLK